MTLTEIAGKINESNPAHKISRQIEKINVLQMQFERSIRRTLEKNNDEISSLSHMLNTVSPISTLERGYAIVTEQKTNKIVTNTKHLKTGDPLRIRLAASEIESTVDKINEK
jgi:exodeoxyribonuclease VII large subunit